MIQIVADTTCGIPLDQLLAKGIHVLPQIITFGDASYRDDIEIDTDTFLEKLIAAKQLPGTAAPPPALYGPIYKSILDAGDIALVITPSEKVSGTYRSALVAAEEFQSERIHVLDTGTIAGGLGSLVLQAQLWAQQGMDIETLKSSLRLMAAREKAFFVVDTLEYLYKGGRIGGASRLFGSVLQIKPILTVRGGQVEPYEKVRTLKQALATIIEIDLAVCRNNPNAHLTISHCAAEEQAKQLKVRLERELGLSDIPVFVVPPAIVVHAGPGVITTSCFSVPE
ncbi:MAG TPA: DegV family protein [Anaerolineaceae bacterium]|jgi:DegV family protein with EDD domain|nr:DegV family protein [Anaerolineaceae bacterium]NMD27218.1 DegV family protein [Chloroflexota bacterium]HOA21837.1 DegV family protein [Anaerolineaceae bacterium]HOG77350.1 DegV family protein [Anaerolineaceae bacterium]